MTSILRLPAVPSILPQSIAPVARQRCLVEHSRHRLLVGPGRLHGPTGSCMTSGARGVKVSFVPPDALCICLYRLSAYLGGFHVTHASGSRRAVGVRSTYTPADASRGRTQHARAGPSQCNTRG